jgi:hypothetical protein
VRPSPFYLRATNFAILTVGLGAWSALLAVLLQRVLAASQTPYPLRHAYLVRLAWLIGALLMLSLLVLAATVIHYLGWRLTRPPERFTPTPYEDAWTEAGRRVKAEDAPPVFPYETDQQEDQG